MCAARSFLTVVFRSVMLLLCVGVCLVCSACGGQQGARLAHGPVYGNAADMKLDNSPVMGRYAYEQSAIFSFATASGGDDFDYDMFAESIGEESFTPSISDPLEPWNRFWFTFNDIVYTCVVRPLYTGYDFIMPDDFQSGISNFFHNLAMPLRLLNNLLQGKFNEAGVELGAFIINTTIGFGGLFDVASRHEEVQALNDEDFGQTLGSWGAGEGIYLVWPLLGPSNLRDTVGMVGDFFSNPLLYMNAQPYTTVGTVVDGVNGAGELLDTYDTVTGAAIEPYAAMRDAYTQYRRGQIEK